MNPFEELSAVLAEQDVSQAQRETLIDLVVCTMYVDGAIRYEENEQLDEVVARLDLDAESPLTLYLYKSIARLRDFWNDPEAVDAMLREQTPRLDTPALRHMAFALCESIACADEELAEAEGDFLSRLRRHLQIED